MQPMTRSLPTAISVAEIELLGLHRARPPSRLRDFPVPPAEVRGWAEYLRPGRIPGRPRVGLFAPDGRSLGHLTLTRRIPPTPPAA